MDERPPIWDEANLTHLGEDHPERGISIHEIDEVLDDEGRSEVYLEARAAYQVIGRTAQAAGLW
ncbi:MAG: hypothetical protein ACYDAY_03040 [Candidatus Dormibacteria bacterium]